jgi:hypothetical protein
MIGGKRKVQRVPRWVRRHHSMSNVRLNDLNDRRFDCQDRQTRNQAQAVGARFKVEAWD